jgi:hypothetical protein
MARPLWVDGVDKAEPFTPKQDQAAATVPR